MNVLGIETSCDETAASVVRDGRQVLSSVVFSQTHLHAPYGGVVPEIASRSHVETLPSIIDEAITKSGLAWNQIDMIAATYGPGLASSLLVGFSAAKGLAMKLDKPLCAINHIEAHIYSVFLGDDAPVPEDVCPFIALVVSGGHTCLVHVDRVGSYRLLGRTIDDAAGEAFDKGANLLGLGYPGGPVIDKVSKAGQKDYVKFPRGKHRHGKGQIAGLDLDLCFSFSGVKTALLYYLRDNPLVSGDDRMASVAASYQEAIIDALVDKCRKALNGGVHLAAAGGVSLNSRLRSRLGDLAGEKGIRLLLPHPEYCGDNAAMIAGLAGAGCGICGPDSMTLDVFPNLELGVE
ncbi:MAG: tRNA (adenosine(37)-N6)-threonylcarbamoyltransferase complex transferase subunit TsaD [Kiritimatiellae bacterium]|nr:tRNA (adenosine(37)-N6)-threonylcarbamoyltransferase complex transferase subunit TsaD [Kiritimatiellia bacterium]